MVDHFKKNYFIIDTIYNTQRTRIDKAVRVKDNLPVIIKSLNIAYPTEKDLNQFSNGFNIVHDLNNDALIQMYELEPGYNQPAFAMEDIGGISLDHMISKQPLSIAQFLTIALKILENLKHVHECQIIHQDLNPSNIIWNSETNQLNIIDFEMAVRKPDKRDLFFELDQIQGSLAYISPEQTGRLNHSVDYRSDFYSLGVTFYELLTQQKPFISDDYLETIYCHIAKAPENPSKLNSNMPKPLSELILKLMAKMPEERYQSHSGLEYDLLKCQQDLGSSEKSAKHIIGQNDINIQLKISEKIYGRKNEIQSIHQIINQCYSDRKQIILISGDKGTGKTKIIQESQKLMIEHHILVIDGNCEQNAQNIPYSTWKNMINGQIHQWLRQDISFIAHMKQLILASLENHAIAMTTIFPDLEMIIGHQDPKEDIDYIVSDNLINDLFCNLIKIISQQKKFVIMIDDIQWIDAESLQLLLFLLKSKSLPNMTLLSTCRNDQIEKADHIKNVCKDMSTYNIETHHLPIKNLVFDDILNLIQDSMITNHHTKKSLCKLIYSKTRGNAFFVHQLLKTLIDEKIIHYDHCLQSVQLINNHLEQYPVSNNVADLLINRLNKIGEQTQELLKIAACVGDKFNIKTLAIITKQKEFILSELLVPALDAGIIYSTDHTFHFAHQNIKQFILDLISKKEIRSIHLQIGQQLYQHAGLNIMNTIYLKYYIIIIKVLTLLKMITKKCHLPG